MTRDAIDAFKSDQRELSRKRGGQMRAERQAMWERLSLPYKMEWAEIEKSGGLVALNGAFDTMRNQSRNRKIFRRSQSDYDDLSNYIDEMRNVLENLAGEAALIFASVVPAKDVSIRHRADALLAATADLKFEFGKVQLAAFEFLDALPDQTGGQGVLSEQIVGDKMRFFREFAEIARDVWKAAGLTIGGNGVIDQGFGDFLDAVHEDAFGRSIPSRGTLLAALRNTWPGPRIR